MKTKSTTQAAASPIALLVKELIEVDRALGILDGAFLAEDDYGNAELTIARRRDDILAAMLALPARSPLDAIAQCFAAAVLLGQAETDENADALARVRHALGSAIRLLSPEDEDAACAFPARLRGWAAPHLVSDAAAATLAVAARKSETGSAVRKLMSAALESDPTPPLAAGSPRRCRRIRFESAA